MALTKPALTDKQVEVFAYIRLYIQENQYPPSVREISQATGLSSTSTVHHHLRALERKGYIDVGGKARQLRVVNDA